MSRKVSLIVVWPSFEKLSLREALSWIKSFLSGRSFGATVNSKLSEEKQLYLSVPQGGCSSAFSSSCMLLPYFMPFLKKLTCLDLPMIMHYRVASQQYQGQRRQKQFVHSKRP